MNKIRDLNNSVIFHIFFRKIFLSYHGFYGRVILQKRNEYNMKLSSRLENLLEEHNLTQKKLSTELHIAPSTLNGYLRRNREPDFATLIKLANYFQVSTDYLLGVTDIRRPYNPEKFYDDNEEDLLDTYRSLGPQEQIYLIKQAHIYCNHDLSFPQKK